VSKASEWAAAIAASAAREAEEAAEAKTSHAPKAKATKAIREAAPETSDGAPALDLDTITQEAAALGPGMFGYFLWLDERCVSVGMTPTSPWWRWSLGEFFASGKRWGVWQVGRGGSKSTTLERVTAALAEFAERVVPPGQRWELPYVSVGPEDANRRIRGIEAIYTRSMHLDVKALTSPRAHIDHDDIRANPIRVASVAGTIGNLSGLNAIGLLIDEAGKLHDKSTNANPLSEIIASVISAFRARQNIWAVVCSSAMWRSGAFFELIEQGDTEQNYVARIGEQFLPIVLEGLEAVAVWEELGDASVMRPPDPVAAKAVRAHAASLDARSPAVPSWLANLMYGPTPAAAAVALRKEVQALPAKMLGGRARHEIFLREICSVPMAGDEETDYSDQCVLAADMTHAIADKRAGSVSKPKPGAVQQHPLAPPGDARYAGPRAGKMARPQTWRDRKVL
jgi:hypothetical protein